MKKRQLLSHQIVKERQHFNKHIVKLAQTRMLMIRNGIDGRITHNGIARKLRLTTSSDAQSLQSLNCHYIRSRNGRKFCGNSLVD